MHPTPRAEVVDSKGERVSDRRAGPGTGAPPFFTVLIPTYDRCELLPRAVSSVLAQTHRDFELLVVDDASPDATREVVAAVDDPRVVYVRRSTNGGPGATRNTGLAAARGQWITLLDDDDEYLPDFLQATHRTISGAPQEVAMSWCGVRWVRDRPAATPHVLREEVWQPRYSSRHAAYLAFLRSRKIGTNCGIALRSSSVEQIGGFDETFRGGAEDTDFLVRMVRRFDFRVVPEVLVRVHLHGGPNLRRVSPEKVRDYEKLIAKNSPALAGHPRVAADLHYKTGWLAHQAGDAVLGRRHLLAAIRRRPTHLRSWSALVLYGVLGSLATPLHRRLSEARRKRRRLHHDSDEEAA